MSNKRFLSREQEAKERWEEEEVPLEVEAWEEKLSLEVFY